MKRNGKRRTTALIMALSLCLSVLTACGNINAEKEQGVEEKPTYQIDVNEKNLDYAETTPAATDVPETTTTPEATDEGTEEETTTPDVTDTPTPTEGGQSQGGGGQGGSNHQNQRHERRGLTYNDYAGKLGEGTELASLYYWYDGSYVLAVLKPTANSSNKATDILENAYLFPADRMEIFNELEPDKKGRNVYISGQDKRTHITNPDPELAIGVNTEVDLSIIYIGEDRFDLEDVATYGQFVSTLNLIYTDKAIGLDLPSFATLTYSYVRRGDQSGQTFYIERCDAEGKIVQAVPTWDTAPSGAEADQRVTLFELNSTSSIGEPIKICVTENEDGLASYLTYFYEES